ncbi:HAD family hydrolase [Prosthecomicrobium pneumaticum]|uniref:Putative hydrolase of the HAD superfamily n=1 Tax=Prosthecomicrobium pneumaticum TaxID=81895 RepID=A0A7W9FPN7_9HYPH|nr:HAD family hydrolase [Prosthecomicrobium pneumaticum]MBB5754488.1 putative hydrolase of the HAD superfamily [Prosthecomicrobium pneumaticum]
MGERLAAIGFDADDTLWQNERYYRLTEARFGELLADHAAAEMTSARLLEAERRNLALYGFGIKGFTLSMIETAIEITEGRVPAEVIGRILDFGRELLAHPIEPLPDAETVLERLAGSHRLVLVTKGDLFDQERKLAQSGLGGYFHAIEIVSDKTEATYRTVFSRHGAGPERALMIGNSLRSDVLPALAAGAFAAHVPHELTFALEHAEPPENAARFHRLDRLAEAVDLVRAIEAGEAAAPEG